MTDAAILWYGLDSDQWALLISTHEQRHVLHIREV
jgi:hypothetical protein